jgi:TRAP-type C4-dicarboxylate transport system substrate-binding protein
MKRILFIALTIALAFTVAKAPFAEAASTETLKIGVIAPMSGPRYSAVSSVQENARTSPPGSV